MLNKKDKFVYSAIIILAVLFFLSFTKSCSNTDKREILKTALVNQKYEKSINKFEFSKGDNKITLLKKDNMWLVKENDSELTIPAESKKVNSLIKDLTAVREMYKLQDKFTSNSSFGLKNDETFTLTYTFQDGSHSIFFGNQDFAQTSRYIMTDKNLQVYELDSSLDKYISTNSSLWVDPFLISQEVFGSIKSDFVQSAKVYQEGKILQIQDLNKLLELRHGGYVDFTIALPDEIAMNINLELGNKSFINIEIYTTNLEQEYIVKSEYSDSNNSKYYTCTKISSWTYNKIKEITL